jgi:hypothetical protein
MDYSSQNQPFAPSQGAEVSSFGTRAMNVFMSPGELYDEVNAAPVRNTSWAIPFVLLIAVSLLIVFAMGSNPSLREQVLAPQREEMQNKVASGEMTQEQADQAREVMESPALFIAMGSGGVILVICAMMFISPLVIMLVMKGMLKYGGSYKKVLEVYGLAALIAVVGALVTAVMMTSMDSMLAKPGLSLLVMDGYDRESFVHNFLASVNVFSVWQMAVLGIGIGKIAGAPSSRGMTVSFGLWVVWLVIAASLGWGGR